MKKNTEFIKQTAKDYGVPFEVVKDILWRYGLDGLYRELERVIEPPAPITMHKTYGSPL